MLEQVVGDYPERFQSHFAKDVPAQAWHLEIVRDAIGSTGTVVDVGGGISPFAPGAAELGYHTLLFDDHLTDSTTTVKERTLEDVIKPRGVEVHHRDVQAHGLGLPDESVDAFTSFGVLEHLHGSPKPLLEEMMRCLRPGGVLFLGAPNCVNLRKRLTVPFGYGKWSRFEDWYEPLQFRGHVREPDVEDLRRIGEDMGLAEIRILGRNWIGYVNHRAVVRALTPWVDRLLQLRPSLCSEIDLLGRKPGSPPRTAPPSS